VHFNPLLFLHKPLKITLTCNNFSMIRSLLLFTFIQCNILFSGICQESKSQQFGSKDELLISIEHLKIERLNMKKALRTLVALEQELQSKESFSTIIYLFINRNQIAHESQRLWVFGLNDKTAKYIYSYQGTESFNTTKMKKHEISELKTLVSNYEPSNSYLQLKSTLSHHQMLVIFKSDKEVTGIFTNHKFESIREPNYPSETFVELANYLWIYH